MSRYVEICKKPEWFLAQAKQEDGRLGYPIYYRYAICYSIAQNITKPGKNLEWITQEMNELIKSFKEKKLYICDDFLELYPLAENTGFVLVDQTDSYYPLIIYAERLEKEDKKSRVYAFGKSLDDINENLENIYNQLLGLMYGEIWDEKFQKELSKIFTI
ncbi:MAG: hypothetical protein ICV54_24595 [Nostoc sp. C3-bin3]|nr:hypothetical protein [Nostoc sp. C3-bin3]